MIKLTKLSVKLTPFFWCITFFLSGLTLYHQVLFHDFQYSWDDQIIVINDYTEGGLTWQNLKYILTDYYKGQYAPVNQLYYTTIHSLFGYNPFFFHGGGIILHILNSILVISLVNRILIHTTNQDATVVRKIALISAFIFLVHPVSVESVAWISASKILWYSFFYLLAILTYIKYIESQKIHYYLITTLLFCLSFFSKEQAITFPVCALLIDYFYNRSPLSKRIWIEKIPLFILSVIFGVITMESQAFVGSGVLSEEAQYPLFQRLIFASYAICEYTIKCVFPMNLSYIYLFPMGKGEALPVIYYIYPTILVGVLIVSWQYWKNKLLFFCTMFFLLHIAITLHIIPIARFVITADRYLYLSSIGVIILIVFLFYTMNSQKRFRVMRISVSVIYLSYLIIYTYQRSLVWKTSDTLKKDIIERVEPK